ncbi:MAG: hypothetical protein ABSB31_06585 [Dehalococcoidia bacterium]|jgi:flagellar biosynthesis protein FliQ
MNIILDLHYPSVVYALVVGMVAMAFICVTQAVEIGKMREKLKKYQKEHNRKS